jgi:site-specific recombinase XerD
MNVEDLVTRYVAFRKALGERCQTQAVILRGLCRAVGPRTSIRRVRRDGVAAFLAGPGAMTNAWYNRYYVLKGFFRFAVSRGHLAEVPLPAELPKRAPPFVPYIYSRDDLRRLLSAIPSFRRCPGWIEPPTLRAILLLLYGAGLRDGEALRLSVADVDLPNGLLTVRGAKFFKSRLVPIGRSLTKVLSDYMRWRTEAHPGADGSRLFLYRHGSGVSLKRLQEEFRRLQQYAGVSRSDGARYQPRLHDLRHTFAVHRLTEWYRQEADVRRLVHHLSVYLGHAYLRDTAVYLTMTPELLRHAGTRFERYARGEDRHA